MNRKLISVRLFFSLYYLRHCAPTLHFYGTSKEVLAGKSQNLCYHSEHLSLSPFPSELGALHLPETLAG